MAPRTKIQNEESLAYLGHIHSGRTIRLLSEKSHFSTPIFSACPCIMCSWLESCPLESDLEMKTFCRWRRLEGFHNAFVHNLWIIRLKDNGTMVPHLIIRQWPLSLLVRWSPVNSDVHNFYVRAVHLIRISFLDAWVGLARIRLTVIV